MATIKINVMSIVAIILTISGIIAAALLESVNYRGLIAALNILGVKTVGVSNDYANTYLAFLIIAIILALVVLIVTCMDVESITGKTFLIYGLTAVLLLVGIILFGIFLDGRKSIAVPGVPGVPGATVKTNINFDEHYASIVFAVVAFVAAVAGAVAPFVCNK